MSGISSSKWADKEISKEVPPPNEDIKKPGHSKPPSQPKGLVQSKWATTENNDRPTTVGDPLDTRNHLRRQKHPARTSSRPINNEPQQQQYPSRDIHSAPSESRHSAKREQFRQAKLNQGTQWDEERRSATAPMRKSSAPKRQNNTESKTNTATTSTSSRTTTNVTSQESFKQIEEQLKALDMDSLSWADF